VFDALGRHVTRFAWDAEVAPGVTAVGTPGHSIGHTSFVVASGSSRVLVQGDVNNNAVVFGRHPDWQGWFDQDPEQAVTTRRRVYDMLVAEKMPVQAYHHPFPGLSHIERDGAGYRVVPAR
jgi:glyoxylase-like metal-dependent hydrolase (beta-lactamase superfamily II)